MNELCRHPEQLPGEVFLGNFDAEGWRHVSFKTKRLGLVAYDVYGKPLGSRWLNARPGFASAQEQGEHIAKASGSQPCLSVSSSDTRL